MGQNGHPWAMTIRMSIGNFPSLWGSHLHPTMVIFYF